MKRGLVSRTAQQRLRPLDAEDVDAGASSRAAATGQASAETERDVAPLSLPDDHTAWAGDAVSPSTRAQRLLERVQPFLIRVMSFWDHRVTRLQIDDRTLSVDASGSYRVT